MPTNGEIAFWILLCVLAGAWVLRVLASSTPSNEIEDLQAWNRNYDRLQRR